MNTISILAVAGGQDSLGILRLILDAGPVVKAVLALLLVFSVASWAIIFLKLFQLRKAFTQSQEFLKAFWQSGDLEEIERTAEHLSGSPVASIFQAGTAEMNRVRKARVVDEGNGNASLPLSLPGIENVKRALRQSSSTEIARLEAAVPFLATTGNSAPFIGLFGTVWGIMDSFRSIGEVGSASLAVVAPGISEALVATAVGLFAAIPAVIFYNHFTSRIRYLEVEMENFSSEYLNILERHMNRLN